MGTHFPPSHQQYSGHGQSNCAPPHLPPYTGHGRSHGGNTSCTHGGHNYTPLSSSGPKVTVTFDDPAYNPRPPIRYFPHSYTPHMHTTHKVGCSALSTLFFLGGMLALGYGLFYTATPMSTSTGAVAIIAALILLGCACRKSRPVPHSH